MICDKCKKFFMSGNRADGIPNGMKLIMKNGKSLTVCADCVIKVGQMSEEEKDEFFREYKDKEQ